MADVLGDAAPLRQLQSLTSSPLQGAVSCTALYTFSPTQAPARAAAPLRALLRAPLQDACAEARCLSNAYHENRLTLCKVLFGGFPSTAQVPM